MKLIRESYGNVTVGQVRKILEKALSDLSNYHEGKAVKLETDTYYIQGKKFLGITSVGYVDFDNMVEESFGSEDFIEKICAWYDKADYNSDNFKEVDAIFHRLDPDESYEQIDELLNDNAKEQDLDQLSKITGISR